MDNYILYGNNNINPSYNYCANNNEMQHLEKKKKKKNVKKQTCGSKEVKLSTDPQSVAARERRHRISERFKILQSLVPGGSKLDTVSMLEEAIVYIKFLKTQLWWLIHYHTHQSHNISSNINNSNNHLIIDEQPSAIFYDLPCRDCDSKQISTQDDRGQNANNYDHEMAQLLEFQDSWFQVEGAQQAMHFDDVLMYP